MKRIKFIKPAKSRLFFFLILFLPLFAFTDTVEDLKKNLDCDEIKLFFKKEIQELNGTLMGKISGKINLEGNKIEAFVIYKDTVRIIGYDGYHPYEMLNNKKVTDFDTDKAPGEIDIRAFINPIINLSKYESRAYKSSVVFYPKTKAVDSTAVFLTENLIDSVLVFRKENLLLKTLYKEYKNGFPIEIVTFDYEKSIIERVIHYKIEFHRKKY